MTRNATELNTLVLNLAYAHLSRMMKDYIKPQSDFTVCCVLEDTGIETSFVVAATKLFQDEPADADGCTGHVDDWSVASRFVIVPSTTGRNRNLALYRSLNECHRCIFLYSDVDEIPEALLDGADAVMEIGKFSKEDVKEAFKQFFGHTLIDEHSEYLASIAPEVLDVSFRKTGTFSQGLSRVQAIEKARDLRRAAAEEKVKVGSVSSREKIRLDDTVGYGEAKEWGLQLRDDVKRVQIGELDAESLDRGAILSGPPGTGKSHFAKLLAEACKIPFLEASYAEWQKAGHMGEQLQAMEKTFAEASDAAPCILLVDEVDSFCNRDNSASDYSDKVVNAFLQKLDGPSRKPGVVVIGTTNNLDRIDPAILRPGRFSEIFRLELPTASERLAIAQQYLNAAVPSELISEFSDATADFSGDGVKHLARKALKAMRTSSDVTLPDAIRQQLPRYIRLSDQRLYGVAVHECGHALVALRCGIPIDLLMISDRLRETTGSGAGGRLITAEGRFERITASDIRNKIAVCLGGLVAENILLGGHEAGVGGSATSDLPMATDLATMYEACLGMGHSTRAEVLESPTELRLFRQGNPKVLVRIEQLLTQQRKRVEQMLFSDRALIDGLARELLVRKCMSGSEVSAYVSKFPARQSPKFRPVEPGAVA